MEPPYIIKRILLLFSAIIMAAYLAIPTFAADDQLELYNGWDDECKEYTYAECESLGLDYDIVVAIIYNESRFQASATHLNTNGTTDWGLMQINDVCFDYLNENCGIEAMDELLDPYTAIRCGTAILKYHKDYTQDDSLALLRYQVGEGAYRRMEKRGITSNDTHSAVSVIADIYKSENIASELMI